MSDSIRIFQLAKELNISHTDILDFLKSKDISVSSHMSPIDGKTQQLVYTCLLYTSPSPRDRTRSRMPSSA